MSAEAFWSWMVALTWAGWPDGAPLDERLRFVATLFALALVRLLWVSRHYR